MPSYFMVAFCYLIDVTTNENRGLRLGIMKGCLTLGGLLGNRSSYLFAWICFVSVFWLTAAFCLIAWTLAYFFLKETITAPDDDYSFFTLDHIKEMVHMTFKPRKGYNRPFILLCTPVRLGAGSPV